MRCVDAGGFVCVGFRVWSLGFRVSEACREDVWDIWGCMAKAEERMPEI